MRGDDALRLAGRSRRKEQNTGIAWLHRCSSRIDQRRIDALSAREEGAPTLDRAKAFIAVDQGEMAKERELRGRDFARFCARDPRFEIDEDFREILLEHPAFQQQHRTAAHLQHGFQFGSRGERAHRHGHAACQGRAENAGKKFKAVRRQHADAGALTDAAREQRAGDLHRARPKIVVSPTLDPVAQMDHRRFGRAVAARDLANETAERQRANALLFHQRDAAHDGQALGNLDHAFLSHRSPAEAAAYSTIPRRRLTQPLRGGRLPQTARRVGCIRRSRRRCNGR